MRQPDPMLFQYMTEGLSFPLITLSLTLSQPGIVESTMMLKCCTLWYLLSDVFHNM